MDGGRPAVVGSGGRRWAAVGGGGRRWAAVGGANFFFLFDTTQRFIEIANSCM